MVPYTRKRSSKKCSLHWKALSAMKSLLTISPLPAFTTLTEGIKMNCSKGRRASGLTSAAERGSIYATAERMAKEEE